jgi:hypothetical protein
MHDQWAYSRLHQREMLRKAEQIRLVHEAMGKRRSLFNRALARLGGWMVALGQALHTRYAPARKSIPTYVTTPSPVINGDMASWYVSDARCEREPSGADHSPRGLFKTDPHPRNHNRSDRTV